jgi:hypothetical protein
LIIRLGKLRKKKRKRLRRRRMQRNGLGSVQRLRLRRIGRLQSV